MASVYLPNTIWHEADEFRNEGHTKRGRQNTVCQGTCVCETEMCCTSANLVYWWAKQRALCGAPCRSSADSAFMPISQWASPEFL